MNSSDPLYSKALHQAAHVVVAIYFGWWISVQGINLEEDSSSADSCQNSHCGIFSKNHYSLQSKTSILLAGELIDYVTEKHTQVIQELDKQIEGYRELDPKSDLYLALNTAWQELSGFKKTKEHILDCAQNTLQILHKHRLAVQEFADFLYSKKSIDYNDFLEFTFSADHFRSLLNR